MIQRDVDDFQPADGIKQFVNAQFLTLNPIIEVLIVYRQIRIRDTLLILLKKNTKCLLVILDGFQLNTLFFRLVFINQILFENLIRELTVMGYHLSRTEQMIDGQKEQRDGGQALLTINDEELLHCACFALDRNDTAKEMALSILTDDFYQVVIELLAVFHLPVVVPLVNRDNEALGGTIHIFN